MREKSLATHGPPILVKSFRTQHPASPDHVTFPVVGIGASAGGLEALEQFLRKVPLGSGMAFVIVQHLDPTHKGILPELLQRATKMKVIQVRDCTKVQPNCVYVIPPNKDMSILHGVLHLLTPAAPRGLRLPIDIFFRALAQDQQERSIGVILSGMGSDGTLGVRAIKENAGEVLVQESCSAKFDGTPRSAIDAKASCAEVRIVKHRDVVRMEIIDDGTGFATNGISHSNKSGHLGLLGMRERTDMVGGTFSGDTAPGKHTIVRVEIPFEKITVRNNTKKKSATTHLKRP